MDSGTPVEPLVFNGLDAESGAYLTPPMTVSEVSALAQGKEFEKGELDELKQRSFDLNNPNAGVEADARNLDETGWGIIFACDTEPAVRDMLQPLLNLRKQQAGDLYKEFWGDDGYQPGESKDDFLTRFGMGPGPANPQRVPYYLLIVGAPDKIPYSFQYQLDVQYAVGRIHFPNLQDYAAYAGSVVASETGLKLRPEMAFFATENSDDKATQWSSQYLIQPVAQKIGTDQPKWVQSAAQSGVIKPAWTFNSLVKDQARRQALSDLLNGPNAPALLFTASHGISFKNGNPKQLPHQGALVCQDWPGPELNSGPIQEDWYFAADHLSSDANLLGMIAFFFACYGAGTPQLDEFVKQGSSGTVAPGQIAPYDFVASLPAKMMSLPKGGALAVVGHIERAWGTSFFWGQAGAQDQVFVDCFTRLIKGGYPVGYAAEVFNNRYAEISSDLSTELFKVQRGKKPDDALLARLWMANNDSRNYVILGDPAARLSIGADGGENVRHVIKVETPPVVVVTPAPTSVPQQSAEGSDISMNLIDDLKNAQANLGSSLQQFVNKLGSTLSQALDDAASLEVATYTSDNMEAVTYNQGKFNGAKLRAVVRIKIDGDTLICVPEDENGGVNLDLWKIHMDMVQQAQASRAELIKAAISAASQLVGLTKA